MSTKDGSLREDARSLRLGLTPLVTSIGLPQLVVLLAIAERPGVSVSGVAEMTNLPQQSASRAISMLSGRYELPSGQPMEPLIEQAVNVDDPRKRSLTLNAAGERIVRQVLEHRMKADE